MTQKALISREWKAGISEHSVWIRKAKWKTQKIITTFYNWVYANSGVTRAFNVCILTILTLQHSLLAFSLRINAHLSLFSLQALAVKH